MGSLCSLSYFKNRDWLKPVLGDQCFIFHNCREQIQLNRVCVFSSPEHEVLMVSYCDQSLSVVRALSTFCFKRLLLQNGETDFKIILQEDSLGDPLPKLLKPFRSVERDGHQS